MFMRAHEQLKKQGEGAIARLRPVAPLAGRGETHFAFKVIFKGEKVEGDGGPYRQFFDDISNELQPKKQGAEDEMINLLKPSANNLGNEMHNKHLFVLNPRATST